MESESPDETVWVSESANAGAMLKSKQITSGTAIFGRTSPSGEVVIGTRAFGG
jgi:hypothetical protein